MQRALRIFSKVVCGATLALIFIGGMVTSTGSGLSVPDWPTTFGHPMFAFPLEKMTGKIFYEHGHRMVASVVGFLTLVLAAWLPFADKRSWVRKLGYGALGAVILQGVLGGVTVLMKLPPLVSIAHGVLAQTFFVLTIVLAYSLSAERRARELQPEPEPVLAGPALLAASLVFVQLILGALMRHTQAGLAIPDFPTMGGSLIPWFDDASLATINGMLAERWMPPATLAKVWIHAGHRVGALLVTLGLVYVSLRARAASPKLKATVLLADSMLLLQITLGMFTLFSRKQPVITSLHVATGAALLGVTVLLALRACPLTLSRRTRAARQEHANGLEVQPA
jgi:cytochrome c oxidase assembly protein subunit 15